MGLVGVVDKQKGRHKSIWAPTKCAYYEPSRL